MPLKLICGPTGSGKTTLAIEAFLAAIDRGDSAVFIAPSGPDRLHFKRRILEARPVLTAGRIMTFGGLLKELTNNDGNEAAPVRVLGQTERRILLRAITEGPGSPQTLSDSSFYDGFITELIKLIDELEIVGIKPGQLGDGLRGWAGVDPWRRGFNKDLFRLYEEYETVLAEKGVEDAARMQRRTVDLLAGDHSLLEYRSIIVDGFHDFTTLQMKIITALRECDAEMMITLPYEEGKVALAAPAKIFGQLKPGVEVTLLKGSHEDQRAPAIMHIAENLFEEEAGKVAAGDSVTVLQAAGVRGQAELVAAEVLKLWREKNIGLDDMAVVTHSHGPDSLAIASAFADYGIPFELPAPIALASTPVGQTAVAALQLVAALENPKADSDSADSLLAYLRSPLPMSDRNKVDSFDRYIRSHGGENLEVLMLEWKERSDQPLDEIYRLLDAAALGSIAPLAAELGRVMREMVQAGAAIASFEQIEMDTRALEDLVSTCEEVALADELTCDYPKNLMVADDDSPRSHRPHQLIRVIEMATTRARTGSRRNCVRLLDPHRVLNQRFDALFVCGLLEGQFPSMGRDNVFFSEADRSWLRDNAGLQLESNALRLDEERFLFHRTLTRARHKIYLCYPYCDQEGKPTVPSLFVDDTLDLFEDSWGSRQKRIGDVAFKLADAPTGNQALLSLASMNPAGMPGTSVAVLKDLEEAAATVGLEQRLKHCLEAKVPDWAVLGEDVLAKLKEREYFHVTELERYLECPFRYFIEKLVKPQPLEMDDFYLVRGSVVHDILHSFYGQLQKGAVLLAEAEPGQIDEARRIMAALVDEKAAQIGGDLRSKITHSELAAHLDRFISRELCVRPEFDPRRLEWSFGICDAGLPDEKTMIRLGDVMLCGRVDRIDVRGLINQAVVIDYKTSSDLKLPPQADYAKNGTIQLPLYMYAVQEILGLEVLAGEYYGVLGRRRRGLYLEEYADILGAESGEPYEKDFVAADTFEERLETARNQAIAAATGIRAGDFKCKPDKDTCKYCSYDCLCRSKADEWPEGNSEEE